MTDTGVVEVALGSETTLSDAQASINAEIETLKRKREEIDAELADAKRRLEVVSRRNGPIAPRFITHKLYARLAVKDSSAWTEVDFDEDDVYGHRDDCQVSDCWYGRHFDRLNELEVYEMTSLCGDAVEATICDVCFENGCESVLFETSGVWKWDSEIVIVDRNRYDAKYHAKIDAKHTKLLADPNQDLDLNALNEFC
jgi:hypothetical protein